MGKNVSWLCKALGSHDLEVYWRLPHDETVTANMVKEGRCHQRACVKENTLTVRYLHPADSGKYTCVAKNKFGQDQRKVVLDVKVNKKIFFSFFLNESFLVFYLWSLCTLEPLDIWGDNPCLSRTLMLLALLKTFFMKIEDVFSNERNV